MAGINYLVVIPDRFYRFLQRLNPNRPTLIWTPSGFQLNSHRWFVEYLPRHHREIAKMKWFRQNEHKKTIVFVGQLIP